MSAARLDLSLPSPLWKLLYRRAHPLRSTRRQPATKVSSSRFKNVLLTLLTASQSSFQILEMIRPHRHRSWLQTLLRMSLFCWKTKASQATKATQTRSSTSQRARSSRQLSRAVWTIYQRSSCPWATASSFWPLSSRKSSLSSPSLCLLQISYQFCPRLNKGFRLWLSLSPSSSPAC